MEEPFDPSSSSPTSSVTSIPPSTTFVQPPTSSHKTLFIIIGIIILLIIGVISYLLLFKGKDSSSQNSSSTTNPSIALTPQQTFVQFRTELAKATNFDEYAQVSLKWSDKENAAKIRADQEKLDKATPEQKLIGYNLVKTLTPPLDKIDLINAKKDINQTTAVFIVTAPSTLDNKTLMQGTITLLKEGTTWKINKESWSSRMS